MTANTQDAEPWPETRLVSTAIFRRQRADSPANFLIEGLANGTVVRAIRAEFGSLPGL